MPLSDLLFFFNDTATTEIYTLSLHDALPISLTEAEVVAWCRARLAGFKAPKGVTFGPLPKTSTGKIQKYELRQRLRRSEEHTSELQSRQYLVCRLLLEKKKYKYAYPFLAYPT